MFPLTWQSQSTQVLHASSGEIQRFKALIKEQLDRRLDLKGIEIMGFSLPLSIPCFQSFGPALGRGEENDEVCD